MKRTCGILLVGFVLGCEASQPAGRVDEPVVSSGDGTPEAMLDRVINPPGDRDSTIETAGILTAMRSVVPPGYTPVPVEQQSEGGFVNAVEAARIAASRTEMALVSYAEEVAPIGRFEFRFILLNGEPGTMVVEQVDGPRQYTAVASFGVFGDLDEVEATYLEQFDSAMQMLSSGLSPGE